MKIATFNANGIRARLEIILTWLSKEWPDVLCVQETKVQDKDFPQEPFQKLGYHCSFRGQKSYNGVAILSKPELADISFGFGDGDATEEPRLIAARLQNVHIVNTYVPQGYSPNTEKFRYKLDWFQRLHDYFSERFSSADLVLWLGDFNVAPEPIDVYDPEQLTGAIGFHPDERSALAHVQSWGFVDIFRKHNRHVRAYTFWDYRMPKAVERGLGWRIDHIWATPELAETSVRARIDVEPRGMKKPSDHTFVTAEFTI